MTGTEPPPLSAPPRRPWPRRILRAVAWTSGLALGLVLVAWTFRARLVAPFLIGELEAYLERRHSVRLEIGALEGSYLADLRLVGIELEGSSAASFPVRRLVGGELLLEYSLPGLLRHGLDGLHGLTFAGDELVLALEGSAGAEPERSGSLPALPVRLPRCSISLARLELELGGGEGLDVEDLELRVQEGGDQDLSIDASRARMRATRYPLPETPLELRGGWGAGKPTVERLRGLGFLLEGFDLDLEGGEVGVRRLAYQPEEGELEVRGLRLPLDAPDLETFLEELRGELTVRLVKLPEVLREVPEGFADAILETFESYRSELQLEGRVGEGRIELSQGRLVTRSGHLEVSRGSFEWEGVDLEGGRLELALDVDLPELGELGGFFDPELGELGGSLRGVVELEGPPLALVGDVELQGESLSWGGRPLGGLESHLSFDGSSIRIRELRAALDEDNHVELEGRYLPGEARVEELLVRGRLERLDLLELPGVDGGGLRVRSNLDGPLEGLVGSLELELDDLELTGRPLRELSLRAELSFPELEVSELSFEDPLGSVSVAGWSTWDGESGRLEARLDSLRAEREGVELASTEPATLRIGPEGVSLASLHLEGTAGRAAVDYTAGDTAQSLRVELEGFDPLPLLGAVLPGPWKLGRFDGELEATLSADELRLDADLELKGLVPPGDTTEGWEVDLVGGLVEGRGELRRLQARHPEFGALEGEGSAPLTPLEEELFPSGDLGLRIELQGLRLGELARGITGELVELEGETSGHLELEGSWSEPTGRLELEHSEVFFPQGDGPTRLGPFRLRVEAELGERLVGRLGFDAPGHFQLAGEATVGSELDLRGLVDGGGAELLQAPLEGTLQGSSQAVEEFTYRYESLPRLRGRAEVGLEVGGRLGEPEWEAHARLEEGTLLLGADGVPPLSALVLELRADPAGLEILEARAEMGGAALEVRGGATLGEALMLELSLSGEDVLLHRADGVKLRADLDLGLKGPLGGLEATGELALSDGRFVRNHDPLSFLARDAGGLAGERGLSFRIADKGVLATTRFDIGVRAKEPFLLRNNLVRGGLRPELRLVGTGRFPELRGEIYLDPTRVSLPAGRLEIRSGTIQFRRSEPTLPHLEISGEAFVQGYHIDLQMSGPIGDAELHLSSIPPLPNEDILVLLVTGQLPRNASGTDAVRTVAVYLASDFVARWFSDESTEDAESFFERFDYWSGVDPIRTGIETYHVSFRLSPDAEGDLVHSLVGEQDAYEKINLGYRLLFRLK